MGVASALLALAVTSVATVAADSNVCGHIATWLQLTAGDPLAGPHNERTPMRRYGAASTYDGDRFTVTLGYAFDHARRKPIWFTDRWAFDRSLEQWTRLPLDASPRYHHAMARSDTGHTVLYGGDDGGGPDTKSHIWGSFLSNVMIAPEHDEPFVTRKIPGQAPAARQGHSLTPMRISGCESAFFLFGGSVARRGISDIDSSVVEEADDAFVLCLAESHSLKNHNEWRWAPVSHSGASRPPPRRSHTAVVTDDDLVAIAGGFQSTSTLDDVWTGRVKCDVKAFTCTVTWQEFKLPRPRGGHIAGFVSGRPFEMFVAHGAICDLKGCSCEATVDVVNLKGGERCGDILQFSDSDALPVARYHPAWNQDTSGYGAIVFGGESYRPYHYWNDLWSIAVTKGGSASGKVQNRRPPPRVSLQAYMVRTRDEDEVPRRAAMGWLWWSLLFIVAFGAALVLAIFLYRRKRGRNHPLRRAQSLRAHPSGI